MDPPFLLALVCACCCIDNVRTLRYFELSLICNFIRKLRSMHTDLSTSDHSKIKTTKQQIRRTKGKKNTPQVRNKQSEKAILRGPSKNKNINLRVDVETQSIIDKAAELNNQSRSEFMLSVARERAMEILLDRSHFFLDEECWDAFTESLDDAPKTNSKLKALLRKEAVWETKNR